MKISLKWYYHRDFRLLLNGVVTHGLELLQTVRNLSLSYLRDGTTVSSTTLFGAVITLDAAGWCDLVDRCGLHGRVPRTSCKFKRINGECCFHSLK